jgi:carboxymethylenebutenolidase
MLICAVSGATGHARAADGPGADTSLVRLGGDGTQAFVAWPRGANAAPAVIVVHEWWGLNSQIRRVARQLAQQGYVAIVPDLYHGQTAADAEAAHVLMRGLEEGKTATDIDASIAWLKAQPRTRDARVGVMGFCMGGSIAQQTGMRSGAVSAVVMFYGSPVAEPTRIAALRAPLMGHFGGTDRGIPAERVAAFEKALADAGKDAQIFVYPGAGHAFMNDERDSFHPDASRQAWARSLDFLQKQLKKGAR